ncbi:TPA: lysis protein [Escherichia coli]|nr:lysis protein [Escherichia coli]
MRSLQLIQPSGVTGYTKELADANATIESLRADVSAGRKRLQVAATCAKSTTGASSMGDGESPRLTADAELNYYRLRSGIDRIPAQLVHLLVCLDGILFLMQSA